MSFRLDTDTCSQHIKRSSGLTNRFIQHSGRIAIASIVLAELYAGAYRLRDPAKLSRQISELLDDVRVLDFQVTQDSYAT